MLVQYDNFRVVKLKIYRITGANFKRPAGASAHP